MFYFRQEEIGILNKFYKSSSAKALAIYGRRRIGKTELIRNYINNINTNSSIYFQCTSLDYDICLNDFISQIKHYYLYDDTLATLKTFRDVFSYISKIQTKKYVFIIDEFPFLCKKNDSVQVEFQWIIDNCLNANKLILLGSNMSFMIKAINNNESPLYGRFDEIIEIRPFTFNEVHSLFKKYEDSIKVYALTGGIALYVMYFYEYDSIEEAIDDLFFNANSRLLNEGSIILSQELKQISTYVSIIRCIGTSSKDSGAIARTCNLDQRAVFTYINKLIDMDIISVINNPLSNKKYDKRFIIKDLFFRFYYSFIDPNVSLIISIGKKSKQYILDEKFDTYLGYVYEEIIRNSLFFLGSIKELPFVPKVIGKWWGNVKNDGNYIESEVDIIGYDNKNILIGECKYKNKLIGIKELENLINKAKYINTGNRKVYYLLASKKGFTTELLNNKEDTILIKEDVVI